MKMTKKIFAAAVSAVLLSAVFAGCDDPGEKTVKVKNNSSYGITSVYWESYSNRSNSANTIDAGKEATLTVISDFPSESGWVYFSVNNGTLNLRTISEVYFNSEMVISDGTMVRPVSGSGSGPLSNYARPPTDATLTIKNESSYEITGVLWNGTSFAETSNSIQPGKSVKMGVNSGSSYVRLRPKSNQLDLRVQELLAVAEGETKEFIILNSTVVVKEPEGTTGTLGSFASSREFRNGRDD